MKQIQLKRQWWLAGLLSYLLPGLGQFYNGKLTKGLLLHFCYSTWGGIVFSILFQMLRYPLSTPRILFLGLLTVISFIIHLFIIIEAIRDARRMGPEMHHSSYQKWYIFLPVLVISLTVEYSISMAVRQNIAKPYRIPAASMEPTLLPGDYLISNQLYFSRHNPTRGDVIIHQYPPNPRITYVKRIIGVPGDTLSILNKIVYINGQPLDEPYIQHIFPNIQPASQSPRDNFGPVVIPQNEYFVLGDNRDNSDDSRYWGTVSRHLIHGKPAFIYWSWSNHLPAWKFVQRIFTVRPKRIGKLIE